MGRIQPLTIEQFAISYRLLKVPETIHHDFIYQQYINIIEGLGEFEIQLPMLQVQEINHLALLTYLISEHIYRIGQGSDQEITELENNEDYHTILSSIVLDKYLTNEHLEYKMNQVNSKFYPPISTMTLYLNFVLGMLTRFKQNNPDETLIVDMLRKGFTMGKCIITLLTEGFETEAFSTWRTLHETEAIVIILAKHGRPVIDDYLRHITYGIAFRDGIADKNQQDQIFVEIKDKMRELDLKSKDMKRFIEYGWLRSIVDFKNDHNYKFNFRDGVEKIAQLQSYNKWYEMSSEVAHSSPLLIYSKKAYFSAISLINLYESFFRLEAIFSAVYQSAISEDERQKYDQMRKMYYTQMLHIHAIEKRQFVEQFGKKTKDLNE